MKFHVAVQLALVSAWLHFSSALSVNSECKKLLDGTGVSHLVSDKVYTFRDRSAEYEYKLGVCANVVAGVQTAVTQRELADGKSRTVAVGRLNGTHVVQRRDYVELSYYYGDKYHSHCGGTHRTARIMFVCDPCGGQGAPSVVEEYLTDSSSSTNGHCFYLFEWPTDAVCAQSGGGRFVICKPTGLGPGSIFLIVLLSIGIAYVLFGFLYNRFVKSAKGREQIPNYTFWVTCGDRIADGCDVLCRSRPPSIPMKTMPAVGRGDHQLDLSEDDLE